MNEAASDAKKEIKASLRHLIACFVGFAVFFGGMALIISAGISDSPPLSVLLLWLGVGVFAVSMCDFPAFSSWIAARLYRIKHGIYLIDKLPPGEPRGCVEFRNEWDPIGSGFVVKALRESTAARETVSCVGRGFRLAVQPGCHSFSVEGGTAREEISLNVDAGELRQVKVCAQTVHWETEGDRETIHFRLSLYHADDRPKVVKSDALSLQPMCRPARHILMGFLAVLMVLPCVAYVLEATGMIGRPSWVRPVPSGFEGEERWVVAARIDEQGEVRFGDSSLKDMHAVARFLAAETGKHWPCVALIDGADTTRLGDILKVMDGCTAAGINRFAFRDMGLVDGLVIERLFAGQEPLEEEGAAEPGPVMPQVIITAGNQLVVSTVGSTGKSQVLNTPFSKKDREILRSIRGEPGCGMLVLFSPEATFNTFLDVLDALADEGVVRVYPLRLR